MPTGVVTFVFTDIVDSTRLWDNGPVAMQASLGLHDELLRGLIASGSGHVFSTGGDAFCAAFQRTSDALDTAVAIQRGLAAIAWGVGPRIVVRIGVHSGESFERDGNYFGPTVNRAARIMSLADGGQVLCSAATAVLGFGWQTKGSSIVELATMKLKGLSDAERIHGLVADGLEAGFGQLRQSTGIVGNVPTTMVRLVGRTDELIILSALIDVERVVTLLGPGGVGKTSLALATARQAQERFADGVWWVDLVSCERADQVGSRFAEALGVRETRSDQVLNAVVAAVESRRMLVVVDNAEHVIDAVRSCVAAMVSDVNEVVVLVTSRERLALPFERVVPVEPLATASIDSPAVALFAARSPGLELDDPSVADAVLELCRQVDGLPLAIELAASRSMSMSPTEVLQRLRTDLRVLSDRRLAEPRHSALESTIRWSFDRLDPMAQAVLCRVSVFPTGFDLDAAERVAGFDGIGDFEIDDAITTLVEQSLLTRRQGRYELLESTRAFARSRLLDRGETSATKDALVRWALMFAQGVFDGVRSANEREWVEQADALWPNLMAAFDHALTNSDPHPAVALCRSLGKYSSIWRAGTDRLGSDALRAFPTLRGGDRASLVASACFESVLDLDFDAALDSAREVLLTEPRSADDDATARFTEAYVGIYLGDALKSAAQFADLALDLDGRVDETIVAQALFHASFEPALRRAIPHPELDEHVFTFAGHTARASERSARAFRRFASDRESGLLLLQEELSGPRPPAWLIDQTLDACVAAAAPAGAILSLQEAVHRVDTVVREGSPLIANAWFSSLAGLLSKAGHDDLAVLASGHQRPAPSYYEAFPFWQRIRGKLGPDRFDTLVSDAARLSAPALTRRIAGELAVRTEGDSG